MPKQIITIYGEDVTFLADSGATESVIQRDEFDPTPKIITRHQKTVGASGTSVIKRYTVPLSCRDDVEENFKYFVCLLGIVLISTPQRIIVTRITKSTSFVKYGKEDLIYM